MTEALLPAEFLGKCSDQERADVQTWWGGLNNRSQSEVGVLLDRRNDSRAFVYCDDENGDRKWHELPVTDDDLPSDNSEDYEREWQLDQFEYLVAHPELMIGPDVVVRTFHICVDHPQARRVLTEGELTGDFCCPVGNQDCPIQRFAAKIKHAKLIASNPTTRRTIWACR